MPRILSALAAATLALPLAAQAAKYTAYVGNDQCPTNNSVTQLTGPTWTFGATIGVGNCPAGIAFAPAADATLPTGSNYVHRWLAFKP